MLEPTTFCENPTDWLFPGQSPYGGRTLQSGELQVSVCNLLRDCSEVHPHMLSLDTIIHKLRPQNTVTSAQPHLDHVVRQAVDIIFYYFMQGLSLWCKNSSAKEAV